MSDSPVTREGVARSIDDLRRELSSALRQLDELIRQRTRAVTDAELGPHGRADVVAGRSSELDDARSARELLESADDELAQARSLLS